MVSRHATLAFAALLAATGCRTAGVGNLTRSDPAPPPPTVSASEVFREHNRTAERIESLEAHPSITVTSPGQSGVVQGDLAMERPRNFSLRLSGGPMRTSMADIGSNDGEFWFWVKERSRNKEYYFCNYDESGKSPLATTLQPELIIEALGLRVIPEAEAVGSIIEPGPIPNTLAITHKPSKAQGETLTRMTIISATSRRIREHRVYSGDGPQKTLLAQAVVKKYQGVDIPSEDGGVAEKVYLPLELRLEWTQEKLALDVVLSNPTVNTTFTQSRREALFVEPNPKGYTRVNLAERMGVARPQESTTIRESRTPPPSGIRLLEPSPIKPERTSQVQREPLSLAADLAPPPVEPERVVVARPPQAPVSDFARVDESPTRAGWVRRGVRINRD